MTIESICHREDCVDVSDFFFSTMLTNYASEFLFTLFFSEKDGNDNFLTFHSRLQFSLPIEQAGKQLLKNWNKLKLSRERQTDRERHSGFYLKTLLAIPLIFATTKFKNQC